MRQNGLTSVFWAIFWIVLLIKNNFESPNHLELYQTLKIIFCTYYKCLNMSCENSLCQVQEFNNGLDGF